MLRYPRDMRARWQVIVLVSTFLTLGSQCAAAFETTTPFPRADSPALGVSVQDGLLSVEAKEASWVEVLNEVRQQTGTLLHFSTPLEGSITVSFKDLPAEQALRRLFGPDASFLLFYRAGDSPAASSAFPSKVWVLGKTPGNLFETASERGGLSLSALERTDDPGQEAEEEKRAQLLAALEGLRAEDSAARVQALSWLYESGKADEQTVLSALEAALADTDASVRGQAIQLLAGRGGPDAMRYLRQALGDSDPSVRVLAVESVAPQGQGLTLLQAALSDVDETVRSIAAFRLKQQGGQGR